MTDIDRLVAEAITQADPSLSERLDSDPEAHLQLVELCAAADRAATALLAAAVTSARSTGLSWETIGSRLGMTRQAAQQRFGHRPEEANDAPQRKRLTGLTAFNELDQLNDWGLKGWHSVGFGPFFHDIEQDAVPWEHRRAVIGSRTAHELERDGWELIGHWFPWVYFKRQIPEGAP